MTKREIVAAKLATMTDYQVYLLAVDVIREVFNRDHKLPSEKLRSESSLAISNMSDDELAVIATECAICHVRRAA